MFKATGVSSASFDGRTISSLSGRRFGGADSLNTSFGEAVVGFDDAVDPDEPSSRKDEVDTEKDGFKVAVVTDEVVCLEDADEVV